MMHATGDEEITPGMITATDEAEASPAMTPATGDQLWLLLLVTKLHQWGVCFLWWRSSTRDDPDTGAAEVIPVKIPGTGDA